MSRWSFMLIAVIAAASFFSEPAVGQFKIPKIKVPKITTDAPSTTTSPDTATPTRESSSSVRSDDARGRPIAGAKITFSNSPDGSNSKTSFSSSEYIYGRLDLGGKTVYDAFGLKNQTDVPMYYISYDLVI